jgi:hypothetical protein
MCQILLRHFLSWPILEASPQEARHHEEDEPPQKLTSNPPEALPLLANLHECPPKEARHHEDDEPSEKLTRMSDFKTVEPTRTTTKYND